MANFLDAIMVELGMDTSGFEKGSKDAQRALQKTHDETVKHAKEIQKEVGENLTGAFVKATAVLVGFLAAMAGARSIETFISNVTGASTQLGIMASAIGMTPERLSAIGLAIERAGGSAQGAQAAMKKLSDTRNSVQSGGDVPAIFRENGVDVMGSKDPEDLMNRLVTAIRNNPRYRTDRAKIQAIAEGAGDLATSEIWLKNGPAGMNRQINAALPDATTQAQVDAATKLTAEWNKASQAIQSLGREVLTPIMGTLDQLLEKIRNIVEANKAAISDWVGDKVKQVVDWVQNAPWGAIAKSIGDTLKSINDVVQATTGWKGALELFLAIWTAEKLARIVAAIGLVTGALRGGDGFLGLLKGGSSWLAAGAAVFFGTKGALENDPEAMKRFSDQFHGARKDPPTWGDGIDDFAYALGLWNRPSAHWQRDHGQNGPLTVNGSPVSESTPMPAKIVGSNPATPSMKPADTPDAAKALADANSNPVPKPTPPSAGPSAGKPSESPAPTSASDKPWYSRAWDFITGSSSAPATAPQPSAPAPSGSLPAPKRLGLPYAAPSSAQQSMNGARVGASAYAAGYGRNAVGAGSNTVQIAALNIHPAKDTATSNWLRDRMKQDLFALRSDVGLV